MRKNKRGLTLIESMVTIVLLAIVVMTTIGGFVIARVGTVRANHRTVAMGLIREYMEKEIASGWYSGQYYTLTASGATRNIDGLSYTITPDPYVAGDPLGTVVLTEITIPYKIVGFHVQWNEPVYGGAGSVQCHERATTYLAKHT